MNNALNGGAVESGAIISLATLPASSRQRWLSFGAILFLLVAFCLVAPFAKVRLPEAIAITPAAHATILVTDLTTAVWLFFQVSLLRSRALLALANGYLFTTLVVVAHSLTFPGTFALQGLLGAGTQTTGWLYIICLFSLPVAVLAYVPLKFAMDARGRILASPRSAIFWSIVAVTASVCGIVWGLVIGDSVVPPLFINRITYSPLVPYIGGLNAVVCGIAFLCLAARKPSVLDEFVAISVAATAAEMAVTTFFSAGRFDVGWYASVVFELVSSSAVFLGLFAEITRLYSRISIALSESELADEALRESEERVRLAVAASGMGMWDWEISTRKYFWNDANYRLFGFKIGEVEPSHAIWVARVHPDDLQDADDAAARAQREHTDYLNEYRIVLPDGSTRWVRAHGRFLYHDKKPVRMIGLMEDITEARQQIEMQRVLVAELQHRTRNLMAVVQSIAHQTLDTVDSLAEFEQRFDRRLQALSRVQSLLSRADTHAITLGALVAMEFEALGLDASRGKITFAGPAVRLRKSAVEMLALAIHELLTNAVKYGALASPSGHLAVNWRVEGISSARHLILEWVERGAVPFVRSHTQRRGYGRTLIEEALPYSLGAETRFELDADTLHCRISLPLTTDGFGEMAAGQPEARGLGLQATASETPARPLP